MRLGRGFDQSFGIPSASSGAVDLTSRVMHTTGTADGDDRRIVVVLTSEPTTLSWADSADRITDLTRRVYSRALA